MSAPPFLDLDANATHPPDPVALAEVHEVAARVYGNPGSRHAAGRAARRVLDDCRERLAGRLGCGPDELIVTSGGTESANLALAGLPVRRPADGTRGSLILTAGEHPAVARTAEVVAADRGLSLRHWPLTPDGVPAAEFLDDANGGAAASGALVSLILAHNETGAVADLAPLLAALNAAGVPSHADGTQAVGKVPVDFAALGATALSFGAHKFGGPRGVGGLIVRRGVRLTPSLHGGFQEDGRRPGTEPVALVAGMTVALERRLDDLAGWADRVRTLRDRFEQTLAGTVPPVVVNAAGAVRLPNTANLAFPGCDGEALLVALDLAGVGCSLGSACASGSSGPSPVLVAMGLPDDLVRSSVRFSLTDRLREGDIDDAANRVAAGVRRVRGGKLRVEG